MQIKGIQNLNVNHNRKKQGMSYKNIIDISKIIKTLQQFPHFIKYIKKIVITSFS